MDMQLFQAICLAVLALAYAVTWMTTPRAERRTLLTTIVAIAFGAWLAEDTAILRYRFYAYPDWWWLKLDEVPALVIAIWPVVVISSRAVVTRLWPGLAGWRLAAAVGLAVTLDATLIETIAADASLWRWAEGGYLGVPLIGMLGWGAYAAAIVFALDFRPRGFAMPVWASPLIALALTHALLVAMWWGGFRWFARGDLPLSLAWVALGAGALFGALLFMRRREGRLVGAAVSLTRMLAASVFVVLLMHSDTERTDALWIHLGAVALPYLASVDWRSLLMQSPPPQG
jgi:hypothetical protein